MKSKHMLATICCGLADRCICALMIAVVVTATAWLLSTQMFQGSFV